MGQDYVSCSSSKLFDRFINHPAMLVDQTIPVQFIKASQLAYKPAHCPDSLQFELQCVGCHVV